MVDENEHEDKINKPWEIWAYEKCRECQHDRYMHLVQWNSTNTSYADELRATLGNCNALVMGVFCQCKEFLPPDNLDYIELLAKKRGLNLE
jgi:hypothetical protein